MKLSFCDTPKKRFAVDTNLDQPHQWKGHSTYKKSSFPICCLHTTPPIFFCDMLESLSHRNPACLVCSYKYCRILIHGLSSRCCYNNIYELLQAGLLEMVLVESVAASSESYLESHYSELKRPQCDKICKTPPLYQTNHPEQLWTQA